MRDLLDIATRELRDAPVDHDRALLTLARMRGHRRRPVRLLYVVLPLAATLFAFGSWAAIARERAENTRHVVPTLAPTTIAQGIVVLTPAPIPSTSPGASASASPVVRTPPRTQASSAPMPDPNDALYRQAFEAYRDRNFTSAVDACEAYLGATGSSGRFALEARYYRASSLAHLGRKDEARTALEPFANGDYGGYRRNEARALLDRL